MTTTFAQPAVHAVGTQWYPGSGSSPGSVANSAAVPAFHPAKRAACFLSDQGKARVSLVIRHPAPRLRCRH
jgi:hypothetical protein